MLTSFLFYAGYFFVGLVMLFCVLAVFLLFLEIMSKKR